MAPQPKRTEGLIVIEDARILYPNFNGVEKEYNREGDRNFCVIIPDARVAEAMANDNYNVKVKGPFAPAGEEPEEGADDQPYVQVKVNYDRRAPEIYLIGETSRKKTLLTADTVGLLDSVEIVTCDVVISPYNYKPGKVTAYLRKMYVVQREDALDLKWANLTADAG